MAVKDLITKIILKGQTDPSLQRAFKEANRQADSSLNKLKEYGNFAKKAFTVAAGATVAGLGASAKAAIDYESAFAGVMKTVEETGTTSYEDLSNSIRNMAKNMPATTTEIAGVAEAAGQLGIKADDIEKFTKVMINLGTTTNLSSDEAATAIAKMFNITGTSMQDVDKFGATIVALGNNAATTESDIVNMATRIASSGSQIGLTEQQILALATSLSSVGLESEAGGTAISQVMSSIDKSVALNEDSLITWAKTAGMSTAQFKTMWEKDAYGALQKIIAGMGDTKKSGGNLNILLDELGIKGIRTSDTMKRLSNASGLMNDMTTLANQAWDENSALLTEAKTRYSTMASRIQMLKNRLSDVGITVGQALMPVFEKLMGALENINWDSVGQKIVSVMDWISEHSTGIITIIGMIAGAFAGFKIGGFITTIIGVVKWIIPLIKQFGLLKIVFAALGGPVTLIIAVIGALVGAFVALWMKSEKFRNFWIGLWNGIKSVASTVGNWLKNFFTVTIPNAFNAVITFFKILPTKIGFFLSFAVKKIIGWGAQTVAKAKETGSNFISNVVNFFKQLPYKIGYALGYAIGKIITWGVNIVNWAKVNIPLFISSVITFFKQLPGKVWTWLVNTAQKIIAWGANIISTGKQKASEFISSVVSFVSQLPGRIWTWLTDVVQKVISWGTDLVAKGKAAAVQLKDGIVNKIKEIPSKVQEIGRNIVEGLWNGIVNAKDWVVGKVGEFASGILDGMKKALGVNSPSTITTAFGEFVGQGIPIGLQKTWGMIKSSVGKTGNLVSKGFNKVAPIISPVIGAVKGKIQKFASGGTVTRPQQAIVGDAPETIVPHGNTPRNRALLNEAAAGVGAPIGGTTQINITFAPVINGGNPEENRKMLLEEEEEFERRMDEYFAKKRRLAFA